MKKFEHELAAVHQRLCQMCQLAEEMVTLVAEAVTDRTRNRRDEASEMESRLDGMQTEIDQEAMRLLTVYGPVASSLRQLIVMMHVTAQLERIGDQVINVCESLELMGNKPEHIGHGKICRMADLASEMVHDAVSAYLQQDAVRAEATRAADDMVDALNLHVVQELLSDNVVKNVLTGEQDIRDSLAQILIARHLERIADQAVNICKEVVFMVSGDDVRHQSSAPDEPED